LIDLEPDSKIGKISLTIERQKGLKGASNLRSLKRH